MEDYKKSYKSLVFWLIGFLLGTTLCFFLPIENTHALILLFDNVTTILLLLLTFIIYRNETVYWYTTIQFQDAKEAGSERRKKYAKEIMKHFLIFTLLLLGFSVLSFLLDFPFGVDLAVFILGLIVTCISTIKIKL